MDEKKFTSRKMAQPYMFWVSWFLSRSCHLRTAIWRSLNTAWDQSTTPNNWWSIVLLMSTEPMVLLLLGSRSLLQSIMKKHLFMRGFTFPFKICCCRFYICMSQSSVRLWLRSEISCWRNMIPSFPWVLLEVFTTYRQTKNHANYLWGDRKDLACTNLN